MCVKQNREFGELGRTAWRSVHRASDLVRVGVTEEKLGRGPAWSHSPAKFSHEIHGQRGILIAFAGFFGNGGSKIAYS